MAEEEKIAPWYFPFEEDDSDPRSWDDPAQIKKPALDLEAIQQQAKQEELKEELVRADQRRTEPQFGGDIEREVSRMTRAMAGNVKISKDDGFEGYPELDLKDTIDSLGYFTYESSGIKEKKSEENEARDRTGNFLTSTLESLLDMEYQAGTQSGVSKSELHSLHQLTEAMQDLLYVPPEERNRQNGKRKSQTRFELDSLITLYSPDNRLTHEKKIAPASKYNFQTPAQVTYTVIDHEKNQQLEFEFFPQQYAFYDKRPQLAGSDTSDARDIMAIGDRNVERIREKVNQAEAGLVKPYFKINLYEMSEIPAGTVRQKISEVGGEWISNRVASNDGMRTMYGFALQQPGLESTKTFLPVTQAQGGEGHNIRALHRLVRGFSGLGFNYKPPASPKY